jgi:CHAT domain
MTKHTILFLAANPAGTDRRTLDEECAAIERELRMSSGRDDFDFRSKWAVSVDELMRHLNELQPIIVHFSGHGTAAGPAVAGSPGDGKSAPGAGIFLHDGHGSQYVSERALGKMIASAAPSTRVVVLNACYSATIAESLRHTVGCVVGMDDTLGDAAARSFAVAFYRALGHRRSVGNAVDQAIATLDAKQYPGARPLCKTRDGLLADQVVLPALGDEAPAQAQPAASQAGAGSAAASQPGRPGATSATPEPSLPTAAGQPHRQTKEAGITGDALLAPLSGLLPSQFAEVVFRAKVPAQHIHGDSAPQVTRAIDVIRYFEQDDRLDQLARILEGVATGHAAGGGRSGEKRPS